mmetsp:Transcript_17382/g.29791  ORF Transcript_17382/g.29791 Transcript_17382/m.29791 type:complete len:484 (+) Transcript_17382:80-1531(+)|eukprot:CAMPEP_0119105594 /NCGR_PEP_ID=MMETSP1180-20130426/3509_1 /TAXON_ID=3052 ORGANISM="Chlamydomonas cf sp, Strain CCMP681" /NCGR_SAMPLE_ID=MMETSP1180 /ASSEMBLY_ACC=CAM_ASM_000741 /LENGTH=483 /DNA_ID=CAMNT_0007090683 /DNA_START=1 /DNA_END=1452 /DNA_ORIENTATION=+
MSAHAKWLDSYSKVSKWMERYDLETLLEESGGLVKISNFLPRHVAEGVLTDLQNIPDHQWNATEASADYTNNNINHSFKSAKSAKGLERIFRTLSLLLPDALWTFSSAKYQQSDHIEAHDDRAYTDVKMEDGKIMLCSRDIACIFYLTQDWKAEYGGLLVDLESPEGSSTTYVPEFNSCILFRIPHWHQVTPVVSPDHPRYTLFGWFLVPGELYTLQLTPPPQQQQQAVVAAAAGSEAGDVQTTVKKPARKKTEMKSPKSAGKPGIRVSKPRPAGLLPASGASRVAPSSAQAAKQHSEAARENGTAQPQHPQQLTQPGPALKKRKQPAASLPPGATEVETACGVATAPNTQQMEMVVSGAAPQHVPLPKALGEIASPQQQQKKKKRKKNKKPAAAQDASLTVEGTLSQGPVLSVTATTYATQDHATSGVQQAQVTVSVAAPQHVGIPLPAASHGMTDPQQQQRKKKKKKKNKSQQPTLATQQP